MIASLRGTLLDRGEDHLVVEVGGIGYQVTASPTTVLSVGDVGDEVFVWVHHHIREDAQALYGFPTADARRCFTALLGAHGVGPALALAILSVHGPTDLARVLAEDDVAALCLVPGVGKKTAARLLVELKSRLDIPLDVAPPRSGAGGPAPAGGSARADVREALTGLGYGPEEIRDVLADLPAVDDGHDDAGALLKQALRRLAAVR
jgi:Holliday junction DNA helicase RuvA